MDNTFLGAFNAKNYRPDVHKVYSLGKNHGFEGSLPTKGISGTHVIRVYGINIGSGSVNTLLGEKRVNIASRQGSNPLGYTDSVVSECGGQIKICGWAFDADSLASKLKIKVLIDGQLKKEVTANVSRMDVDRVYADGGAHGFNAIINTGCSGVHNVKLIACNVGKGSDVQLYNGNVDIKSTVNINRSIVSVPEGDYIIKSAVNSNYVWDIYGAEKDSGANLNAYTYNGGNNQKFRLKKNAQGNYTITAVHSLKAIDVWDNALGNGSNLSQYDYHGGANQQFRIYKTDKGYYQFQSCSNSLFVDLYTGVAKNCQNIACWEDNATMAQMWILQPVSNNNWISESEINAAAAAYGISTNSSAYEALLTMNTKYASKLSNTTGVCVFLFEGVGNDSSAATRMNAMAVVVKNRKIVYINRNSSTIPDYPFLPRMNGGTAMPTMKSGIYNFSTVNHRQTYAALNINNAAVVRFNSQNSYYSSTSSAINIHRRSSNAIPATSKGWVNSAGCCIIGKTGTDKNAEYAKFIKAVGIVGSSANGASKYAYTVSGKVIIDRSYARDYLTRIGYSGSAIDLIG